MKAMLSQASIGARQSKIKWRELQSFFAAKGAKKASSVLAKSSKQEPRKKYHTMEGEGREVRERETRYEDASEFQVSRSETGFQGSGKQKFQSFGNDATVNARINYPPKHQHAVSNVHQQKGLFGERSRRHIPDTH